MSTMKTHKQNAIAAGHEETLSAAKVILENGGNAFDAAITATVAMFITEPCMCSAGAGGFAMVHQRGQQPLMLDFFTQTPISKPKLKEIDFFPVTVNFGNEKEIFHVGKASMATPGIVKAIFELHNQYGSMPMGDLLNPVRDLAKNGVTINTFQGIDLGLLKSIFSLDQSVKEVFFKKGEILKEGDHLHMPRLNSFLDLLEFGGEEEFYQGEIGRIVGQASKQNGGFIRRADFEQYQAFWRKPLKYNYLDAELYLPNGASMGGALMTLALDWYTKTNSWVQAIENTRKMFSSMESLHFWMNKIHPEIPFSPQGNSISTNGTSHFNIADSYGNSVNMTISIGEGCGYFIPGTDMQMNNMMGESFLLPDGFHSWLPNQRLQSMMTPTLILDHDKNLVFAGGSGGAGRIPYMIAQVLDRLLSNKESLLKATMAPRVYVDDVLAHVEHGYDGDIPSHLKEHPWTDKSLFFGGVHSIFRNKYGKFEACGDSRRYGVSSVF